MMAPHSVLRQFALGPLKSYAFARNESGFIRLIPLLGLLVVLPAAYLAVVMNNRIFEAATAAVGLISLGSLVAGEISARRTKTEIEDLKIVIHDRDEHIADLDEAGRESDRIQEMLEDQNSTLRSDLLTQSIHEHSSDNGSSTVHRERVGSIS